MTKIRICDKIYKSLVAKQFYGLYGEVSEWFKEPVLKTGDPARDRGFESHPLRQLIFLFNLPILQKYSSGEEAPLLRV